MLRRTSARSGRLPAAEGAVTVAALMPPPVLSNASTPVTKYFDFTAAHSRGPLTVFGSPGLCPARAVRSVLFCLVFTARGRWVCLCLLTRGGAVFFFVGAAWVFRGGGPVPTSRTPPLGPIPVTRPSTSI